MTLIAEIDKLIKEWEKGHPEYSGKTTLQLNWLNGRVESIQETTTRTIKMK